MQTTQEEQPLPQWQEPDELPREARARAARRGQLLAAGRADRAAARLAAAATQPTPAQIVAAARRQPPSPSPSAVPAPPRPRPGPRAPDPIVEEMDGKRVEALRMLDDGTTPHRIAHLLGVSVSQVNRWDRGDQ